MAGEAYILMGDFNLCSSWTVENRLIEEHYLDLWPAIRRDQPGYTEDTSTNRMRLLAKGKHKHVRFDRILMRSPVWRPRSIGLLGTQPISDELPDVFPSDHFGLTATISVDET